jgi:hypothetical protein
MLPPSIRNEDNLCNSILRRIHKDVIELERGKIRVEEGQRVEHQSHLHIPLCGSRNEVTPLTL